MTIWSILAYWHCAPESFWFWFYINAMQIIRSFLSLFWYLKLLMKWFSSWQQLHIFNDTPDHFLTIKTWRRSVCHQILPLLLLRTLDAAAERSSTMIFLTRHEMMSVTFTDGSKSAEKKRKKNPPTPRQAVVAGCGGGGGVGSHVWMSHRTVKCEHTFADATKFQFNTSNYTSLMEKTTVTMAQRRGRGAVMTFGRVKAAASPRIVTYLN